MQLANWRLVKELMRTVDAVLEVVDARDPQSTRSLRLERLAERQGLPVIIVMNKADLVPRNICEGWKKFFELREGLRAVYISARHRMGTRVLRKVLREEVSKSPLAAGVFGIPKVGKSTLINVLKGRHSASTSPYPGLPGYTKKAQVFRIGGNVYLVDTPGIVPPEGVGVEREIRLTPVDTLKNPVKAGIEVIKKVLSHNPKAFLEAYGIDSQTPEEILEFIARRRGLIYKKGGEPILQEAAKVVIRDYLDGKITFFVKPPRP
ncbi:MAG: 50S ribosome-binding GTPase [Desulfurococcales archaeon]|nr:50S ribosome-binding GTPase [Desulfurococcales archaeon]